MKLIFLNRFFFPDGSATSQLLSDLAFHLAESGARVLVITSRLRHDDPEAELASHEWVRGVEVRRVRTTRRGRGALAGRFLDYATFYVMAWWSLRSACVAGDVVVAKTDPPLLSVPAAFVAKRARARLVNWMHDVFPEVAVALGVPLLGRGAAGWLARRRDASLRRADTNVAISDRMRDYLVGRGVAPARVALVPNWSVAGDDISPSPRPADGEFRIGYCGNMGRAHEFETLLGAAERLREEPAIRFGLTGDGARRADIDAAIRARRLDNTRLADAVALDHLGAHLASFDVHFISLRPELEGLVFPSKLYGILAAGRPILFVGDPQGEIAGLIDEFDIGMACAVGDVDALSSAIRRLAGDRELTSRLGRAARALFERDYRSERAHAAWRAVLGVDRVVREP